MKCIWHQPILKCSRSSPSTTYFAQFIILLSCTYCLLHLFLCNIYVTDIIDNQALHKITRQGIQIPIVSSVSDIITRTINFKSSRCLSVMFYNQSRHYVKGWLKKKYLVLLLFKNRLFTRVHWTENIPVTHCPCETQPDKTTLDKLGTIGFLPK